MSKALFGVTYEIVTEESAEHGEAEENGWIVEFVRLRDAVDAVNATRTCEVGGVESIECDSSPCVRPRWITVCNSMGFDGAQESRTLHIPREVTDASARRIAQLIGARV